MQKNEVPLNLAILWHMHQPYYKRVTEGFYQMPWVRLHGLKDYFDMAAILDDYPQIHLTFNLVPSLIEQIQDYAQNNAYDRHLFLTEKKASQLSQAEKEEIISSFFIGNYETMILPYRRFFQLLEKRGKSFGNIRDVTHKFTTQDMLDLQVWSNLAWFDPFLRKDKEIVSLFKKNENFTENDKKILIAKQRQILGWILPKYRELKEKGQIEIVFSPYFHPIMPLLCDLRIAEISDPGVVLPQKEFSHPEDIEAHLDLGIQLYQKVFGDKPQGIWPSEGSVSEGIIPLLAKFGLKWMATDEEILYLSWVHPEKGKMEKSKEDEKLYFPYRVEAEGAQINIIFRSHLLSDAIGFVYRSWDPEKAADNFIQNLHRIRERIPSEKIHKSLVSVILDGENCWEYYPEDGYQFLRSLYQKLSEDTLIETVKISEFLEKNPPEITLPKLFPGSWINHDFRIWIGHPEDNSAWDLLKMTRDDLVKYQKEMGDKTDPEKIKLAWKEIYIAEGSDWCWWYGDEHQGPSTQEFDRIFRSHLISVYELLGMEKPKILLRPVRTGSLFSQVQEPTGLINPILDGEVTHYYEWQNAGSFDCLKSSGAMHRITHIIKGIYFGFNEEMLFFRMDTVMPPEKFDDDILFDLEIIEPSRYRLSISKKHAELFQFLKRENHWEKISKKIEFSFSKLFEIGLPIKSLDFSRKGSVGFQLSVKKGKKEVERWPQVDLIRFNFPLDKKKPIFWGV
ncbi:MAG: glycoside hydrolase family 57 protein [Candidatus Zixiibacteriota bacterium]